MAAKLIAYLGGIRSGKSVLAEGRFKSLLARRREKVVCYLATLDGSRAVSDLELRKRIELHQARRSSAWRVVECADRLQLPEKGRAFLLDGLGPWVARGLGRSEAGLLKELETFLAALKKRDALAVLVLDEAGQGGISANRLQRLFCDLNGRANQVVCEACDEVWVANAGIATRIK